MKEKTSGHKPKPVISVKNLSVCIAVSDLDAAIQWYNEVLGFKLTLRQDFPELSSSIAFLEVNGIRIELAQPGNFIGETRPQPPQHTDKQGITQLSFRVHNIEAVMAEVKKRSITISWDVVFVPSLHLKAALIRDIEGNLIELVEEMEEE